MGFPVGFPPKTLRGSCSPDFLRGPRLAAEPEAENFVAGWQRQSISDLRFEATAEQASSEAEAGCQQAKILRQMTRESLPFAAHYFAYFSLMLLPSSASWFQRLPKGGTWAIIYSWKRRLT